MPLLHHRTRNLARPLRQAPRARRALRCPHPANRASERLHGRSARAALPRPLRSWQFGRRKIRPGPAPSPITTATTISPSSSISPSSTATRAGACRCRRPTSSPKTARFSTPKRTPTFASAPNPKKLLLPATFISGDARNILTRLGTISGNFLVASPADLSLYRTLARRFYAN